MTTEIKMPQLSDTMNAGKILTWRKSEGETISRGDILAEVETDKANLEIESFHQGVLLKILVPVGTTANVGETIAVLGAAGESYAESGRAHETAAHRNGSPVPSQPSEEGPSVSSQPSEQQPSEISSSVPETSKFESDETRVRASPLAKKLAQARNMDLSTITGSGPQGRIIKKDIESALQSGTSQPSPQMSQTSTAIDQGSASTADTGNSSGRLIPLSKMRQTIARRMQESVTQAPHFYVTTSVAMDAAMELREKLKQRSEYKGISVNHFIIKAVGLGLRSEPRVNCCMRDGQLFEPPHINVGIITAIPDGLLIPVIREVDRLPLRAVVSEARAAVERAKSGRPSATDLTGGTFSISNMGMFDVENFTAIINPGQGAVLAVSAVQTMPVVRDNHVTVGKVMKVTLSVDHRIIDGVMGANFLKAFKEVLETPGLLLA